MNQLEELKRIHAAETGTLKSKMAELEAKLTKLRGGNIDLFNENQALKSELEKHSAGVVARFDARTHINNGAVLTDVVDASRGYAEYEYPFRKNKTYEVLILQKETE